MGGRKQLLLTGQRVFSHDGRIWRLCESHMPKECETIIEYIVTEDCHVEKHHDANGKWFLCDFNQMIPAKGDVNFTLETQMNCGRRMFVFEGQPFYVSTGTSNTGNLNFQHVALPFKGLAVNGWFVKYYGSLEADWTQALLKKWDSDVLRLFFQRFETYQQLRGSALVKDRCDTIWDKHPALLKFVMRHEWDVDHFEKVRIPALKLPHRNPKTVVYSIFAHEHRLKINEWLGVI